MLFHSPLFLFYFLPSLIGLYFLGPKGWRNSILLTASLLFYAWGEVYYTLILIFCLLLTYGFGRAIERHWDHPARKVLVTSIGVGLNLGILAFFKYWNFLERELGTLLEWKADSFDEPIHLPLGISFFTFQAISYLIDIHRKYFPAEKRFSHLALYVALFPQLIAGPIVRFREIASQIKERDHSTHLFISGMNRFIIGLAKKTLIANPLGIIVDDLFSMAPGQLNFTTAWLGAILFSLQVYYDFSGYSDMAIGVARLFGFQLPENFKHPYVAKSVTEFWNRWHITLSTWFRDYLFYSLGVRSGRLRMAMQILVVFIAVGFWHGADWNFLLFGFFHGFFAMAERAGALRWIHSLPRLLQHFYLLCIVVFGMVLFRAESLDHILGLWNHMISLDIPSLTAYQWSRWFTLETQVALLFGLLFSMPVFPSLKILLKNHPWALTTHLIFFSQTGYFILLFLSILKVASGTHNPFIYFRF